MKTNTAKKIWIGLFSLITFLSMTLGSSVAAPAFSNEEYIINKISQIRSNPLGYAEALGYNRASLLEALSWPASFEAGSELPIITNFLNQRAEAINSEDPAVTEPVPPLDGEYAFTGDIGGVVSFINFMNPGTALDIIIHNQFARELSPLYEGKRYILSNAYNLLGVSFRGGRTMTEKGLRNAYFISICFGSTLLKSEVQIVNLINQMRAMPYETSLYLSVNTQFLPGDFQPLFLNKSLQSTARAGLSSRIDFPAHALYFGFTGASVVESSVFEAFPETGSNAYAIWLFSSLVINDLKTYPVKNAIFNPAYNEIGSALYYVNGAIHDLFKLTMVSGAAPKEDSNVSRIYGVVFTDIDKNGIYTPGEEASDRVITVYNAHAAIKISTVITNKAGQFEISLPNNIEYRIEAGTAENRTGNNIFLISDQFFNLIVN